MIRTVTSIAAAMTFAVAAGANAQTAMHGQGAAMDALSAPALDLKGKFAVTYDDAELVEVIKWPVERQGDQILVYMVEFMAEDMPIGDKKVATILEVAVIDCKAKTSRTLGVSGYDAERKRVLTNPGGPAMAPITSDVAVYVASAMICTNKVTDDDILEDLDEAEEMAAYAFLDAALGDLEDALGDD